MDQEKEVNAPAATTAAAAAGGVDVTEKKTLSQGNSEALEKCLEENKGDSTKCKDKLKAFKSSPSKSSSSPSPRKPLRPLRLRSGSLSDV